MQRHIPNASTAVLIALVVVLAGYLGWRALAPVKPDTQVLTTHGGTSNRTVVPSSEDHPANWVRIDTRDGFSFYAPPGTHLDHLSGKDTAEGEIVAKTFDLRYDFGLFSDALEGAMNENDYAEERTIIDGHVAILRRATLRSDVRVKEYATATDKSQRLFIGLYMPRVEYRPARGGEGAWIALSIDGAAATPEDRTNIERMFKTIRFDQRPVRHTDNVQSVGR